MPIDHRAALANVKTFPQLIAYLRDEMGWPIARDSFEDVDDLFYDFTADELGIDPKTAAKITEIKRCLGTMRWRRATSASSKSKARPPSLACWPPTITKRAAASIRIGPD